MARPILFGHRGASGVAPENTIPSFGKAVESGAHRLELDVHATRDGVVVVLHDAMLDRTTDGTGPVVERSWGEVSALDAGCRFEAGGEFPFRGRGVRIPTLESVLDAFPDVPMNVEIKAETPGLVESVVELLRRRDDEARVILAAEHDSIMQRIRRAAPEVSTSFSAEELFAFFGPLGDGREPAERWDGVALQIPPRFDDLDLVTPESVHAAHARGLEVHVWTINEVEEARRLLDLGVDGIMSDVPGELAAAIADFSAPGG